MERPRGAIRSALPHHQHGGQDRDAAEGLRRRACLTPAGADERIFLDTLLQIVDANQTPAERKLELFHGPWNGDIDRVFREFAY